MPIEYVMPAQQKIFALIVSIFVFVFIVNMVRKRLLREEYSVLWLTTSAVMFLLVLRYEWLVSLTFLIGANTTTTTLFLFALIFLILLSVQFCIKISRLTDQVKNLSQENALMRAEVENIALTSSNTYIKKTFSDRSAGQNKPA